MTLRRPYEGITLSSQTWHAGLKVEWWGAEWGKLHPIAPSGYEGFCCLVFRGYLPIFALCYFMRLKWEMERTINISKWLNKDENKNKHIPKKRLLPKVPVSNITQKQGWQIPSRTPNLNSWWWTFTKLCPPVQGSLVSEPALQSDNCIPTGSLRIESALMGLWAGDRAPGWAGVSGSLDMVRSIGEL